MLLVTSLTLYSNEYSVISFKTNMPNDFNWAVSERVLGNSIHFVDTEEIRKIYLQDPDIEEAQVSKIYPNVIEVELIEYSVLAVVIDYRYDTPKEYYLYKNAEVTLVTEEDSLSEEYSTVSIINGSIDKNVYGEFVNYFMTISKAGGIITTRFILDSISLTATIGETSIDFGLPTDLGKKGSALTSLLEKEECKDKIYFDYTQNDLQARCWLYKPIV